MVVTMDKARIIAIGHYGLSLIFDVNRFPVAGETVRAVSAGTEKGGKGFNQAYAAAKLGAHSDFITAVGDDDVGKSCKDSLEGTDFGGGHAYVTEIPDTMTACGVAVNSADSLSEVVVFSGAIMSMKAEDIRCYDKQIASADILLIQNEAPAEALIEAVRIAKREGVRIVYNPAPATDVPPSLYEGLYCITPNETEAASLIGADPAQALNLDDAFEKLHKMGAENVIITLGSSGAAISTSDGKRRLVSPLPVTVVNTTGAGDCFNGALAVALAEGKDIESAAVFATAASGLSVSHDGICGSLPERDAVEKVLSETEIKIKTI